MDISRRTLLSVGAMTVLAPGGKASARDAEDPDWTLAVQDVSADLPTQSLTLVHGRPPEDLSGILYRNGPARFRRGDSVSHWFDGDGMVRAFRISPSGATLSARFVDTRKRRTESAEGRMVVGGFAPGAPGVAIRGTLDANAANTSVLAVEDQLWALWEGGSPIALQPETLETIGPVTLRRDLADVPFLAHPRVEPDGAIWNLGVAGETCVIWRLAADGSLHEVAPIRLPRASYVHDFTATERELIVVLQPWVRAQNGAALTDSLVWQGEEPTLVLVIDKGDLSRRVTYELPPVFFFHLADAQRERDGTIRFEGCFSADARHATEDIARLTAGAPFKAHPTRLGLVVLRPDGRADFTWTQTVAEFPQSDRRFAGRARRYTWHTTGDTRPLPRGWGLSNGHGDLRQTCELGGGHIAEEGLFVPRRGASAEGDGWFVAPSLNLERRATELHVFDALKLADGPVCSWRADAPLPIGFHGTFVRKG